MYTQLRKDFRTEACGCPANTDQTGLTKSELANVKTDHCQFAHKAARQETI